MRRIALVLTVLLVVGVAGCGPSPVDNPRVLLVGDSILFSARESVDASLRQAGWEPVVAAVPGSKIEDWSTVTARLASSQNPAIAVVELGTNNCTLSGGCTDLQSRIDQLMTILSSVEVVLWLNVQEDVPLTDNAEFVNAQLDLAADRWPNMKIVDFNGDFEDQPELNLPDQVHLTDQGKEALTKLITDALDPYFPSDD
jgi:lysophospholipase L1-like esterase